jgi:tetratricopeptide (TPR) repeat protein
VLSVAACEAWLQGRSDAALDLALRALTGDPRHRDALVLCGQVHASRGQMEPARACFERALAVHPDDVEALYGLFLAHTRLGNPQAAAEAAARHRQVTDQSIVQVSEWDERALRGSMRLDEGEIERRLAEAFEPGGQAALPRANSDSTLPPRTPQPGEKPHAARRDAEAIPSWRTSLQLKGDWP